MCPTPGVVLFLRVALLPHSSRFPGSILSSGYCVRVCVYVCVHEFSFKKRVAWWIGNTKLPLHCAWSPAMDWHPIDGVFLPRARIGSWIKFQ